MGDAGLEHPPLKQSKTAMSMGNGAKSGAPDAQNASQTPKDPNLVLVVERWPYLPEPVKAGILAMVKAVIQPDTNGTDGAT